MWKKLGAGERGMAVHTRPEALALAPVVVLWAWPRRGVVPALLLAVLEGWSYQRIAVQSDVSVGTVKSRISRARTALRLMLTGEESVVDGAAWSEDHVREVGDSAFAAAAEGGSAPVESVAGADAPKTPT